MQLRRRLQGCGWAKALRDFKNTSVLGTVGDGKAVAKIARLVMLEKGDWGTKERSTPMYLPDEFLRQAAECERMAKSTRNPANKTTWTRMAERWVRCAETAKRQTAWARSSAPPKRSRRPVAAVAYL
jgi:hypothetical protein